MDFLVLGSSGHAVPAAFALHHHAPVPIKNPHGMRSARRPKGKIAR